MTQGLVLWGPWRLRTIKNKSGLVSLIFPFWTLQTSGIDICSTPLNAMGRCCLKRRSTGTRALYFFCSWLLITGTFGLEVLGL